MTLEALANELLLEIFEFFTTADLFHAFHGLNSRFDALLFTHIELSRTVDFRLISKHDFDIICQQYLPLLVDKIMLLCLSDANETPAQSELFLSHLLTLRQFSALKSLSLNHFCAKDTMNLFVIGWHHLTHLNIVNCYFEFNNNDIIRLINHIWSLSHLIHCHLDINSKFEEYTIVPTMISLSLQYLYIRGLCYDSTNLARLLENTPCLRFLRVSINQKVDLGVVTLPISTITTLNVSYRGSEDVIRMILTRMPNLYHLNIDADEIRLNGDYWKMTIADHLPKLKVLRFEFRFKVDLIGNSELSVTRLFDTYKTPFWLLERQWFVRLHQYVEENNRYYALCLDTLPKVFNYPHSSLFKHLDQSQIDVLNIFHISLELPFSDKFWSIIVPKLDQLKTLNISVSLSPAVKNGKDICLELQNVLDRTSCLNSIMFSVPLRVLIPLLKVKSQSVRRLDCQQCNYYFNKQECNVVMCSSIAKQCEVLYIDVKDRTNILDLANTMIRLRALNVRCQDDKWNEKSLTTDDELVEWLQHRLGTGSIVTRDTCDTRHIRLWIR